MADDSSTNKQTKASDDQLPTADGEARDGEDRDERPASGEDDAGHAGDEDDEEPVDSDDDEEPVDSDDDEEPDDSDDDPLDLESRVLCGDGACIGVIGPDGLCKECGKPVDAADRARFEEAQAKAEQHQAAGAPGDDARHGEDEEPDDGDGGEDPPGTDAAPPRTGDLGDRLLCSDGACIGIIGPNGRCKECGKPYTGEPDDGDD